MLPKLNNFNALQALGSFEKGNAFAVKQNEQNALGKLSQQLQNGADFRDVAASALATSPQLANNLFRLAQGEQLADFRTNEAMRRQNNFDTTTGFRNKQLAQQGTIADRRSTQVQQGQDALNTDRGARLKLSRDKFEFNKTKPIKRSVVESIRAKIASGQPLTKGEQRVYNDAQRKGLLDQILREGFKPQQAQAPQAQPTIQAQPNAIAPPPISGQPVAPQVPQIAQQPAPTQQGNQTPLDVARSAIARGAPREKVIERLLQSGIDPTGL